MIAMKKYLIKGALALFAGAFLFSCAEKESEYVPLAQQKVKAFDEVFKEVYGDNIDPYQNWGFSDRMTVANGDSVEPTVIDEIPTRTLTRGDLFSSKAFTRKSPMPSTPTFRDASPVAKKPSMPSYSNSVPDGAKYAQDYQNYQKGDVIYINTAYQTLNNPQNTEDLTIYVDGNVTYCGQTNQNGNGTVFCVTQNSTLTLGAVSTNLTVYLAPGATLDIRKGLKENVISYYPYESEIVETGNNSFSFQNSHAAIYMSAGSTLKATDLTLINDAELLNNGGSIEASNLTLDQNATLWNDGSFTVKSLLLANTGSCFYNAANKIVTAETITSGNNECLLYNDGTVTATGAITLKNSAAEIVNNGTMSGASYSQAAGGKTHNVGTMTITGNTALTNSNSEWQNDGHWTCGSFDVDNYSHSNFNNCQLTVNGRFFLNRGTFVLNSDASVVCNSFQWEDTSDFYLGSKSILKVNGTLTTNNYNSGYGFRGYGDDYAIIQADRIVKGKGDVQFSMSYYGKLYIATDNHFAQGALDPQNNPPAQPYYYYESTVKFQFMRDSCPVTITSGGCSPGSSGTHSYGDGSRDKTWNVTSEEWDQVTNQSGRIFCEDLGKAAREDLDYNDVVFDVIIWKHTRTVQPMKSRITWTTTDGRVDAGSERESAAVTNGPSSSTDTYYAQIQLLAAGGTLPLTVAGKEVHDAFGFGVTTMVNTRDANSTAYGSYEFKDPEKYPVYIGDISKTVTFKGKTYNLKLTAGISHAKDVPIVVNYDNAQVAQLKANPGEPPHKLFVPFNTQWTSERKPLNLAYPNFARYVVDSSSSSWVANPQTAFLYDKTATGLGSMPKVMKMKSNSDIESMDILTSESYTYTTWGLKEIELNVDKFYPGDHLRFYGSGINGESYITVVFADSSRPYFVDTKFADSDKDGNYPSTACIEVLLDEVYCDKLNNSKKDGKIMLQVQGRYFTLDQITRVPF